MESKPRRHSITRRIDIVRRGIALIWLGATAVVSGVVGIIAYQAGWAAGVGTRLPAVGGAPYFYAPHPFFFGFGLLPLLFLGLVLLIALRVGRRWGPGGWGPGPWGPGAWAAGRGRTAGRGPGEGASGTGAPGPGASGTGAPGPGASGTGAPADNPWREWPQRPPEEQPPGQGQA
jgi:hypothetical protein